MVRAAASCAVVTMDMPRTAIVVDSQLSFSFHPQNVFALDLLAHERHSHPGPYAGAGSQHQLVAGRAAEFPPFVSHATGLVGVSHVVVAAAYRTRGGAASEQSGPVGARLALASDVERSIGRWPQQAAAGRAAVDSGPG